VIGYYVHHVGRGHAEMAHCIAGQLADEVTGLSSLTCPPGWPGEWLTVPRDDTAVTPIEPDAHGQLHWAPLGYAGLRDRMAAIAKWIEHAAPSTVVVDVSIEVTALVRLLGVPVVAMALPGRRSDPGHRLCYTLAETLLAPWPAAFSGIMLDGDSSWEDKLSPVGAFSRFDGRAPEPIGGDGRPSVLVLQGSGGSSLTNQDFRGAAAATPGWTWTVLGGAAGRWADDPWPALRRAAVVVTHAGLNALAAVAAARKPAVVVPQARPHDEQLMTARALESAGLAVIAGSWPQPARWPSLLRSALDLGGGHWSGWSPGNGAHAAAQVIESVSAVAAGKTRRGSRCAVR
jgi:hypothetical protein